MTLGSLQCQWPLPCVHQHPLTSQAGAKGQGIHEWWCRQADLGVLAEVQEHGNL